MAAACASWLALPVTKVSKTSAGFSLFRFFAADFTVACGTGLLETGSESVRLGSFKPRFSMRNSIWGGVEKNGRARFDISDKNRSCTIRSVKLLGAVRTSLSPSISKINGLIHELYCCNGSCSLKKLRQLPDRLWADIGRKMYRNDCDTFYKLWKKLSTA